MAATDKDTIYIDIDDEITGIIDKVRSSSGKVVALVLPKRAAVFQSIVNMKLLKRSADEAKKHLVLITSEAGLMPLAATVGLYVAKTPQSKPEIPVLAGDADAEDAEETASFDDDADEEITTASAGSRPVGELASRAAGAAAVGAAADEVETLDLDNDDDTADATDGAAVPKGTKGKKLHIPNFDKFRLRLVLGALLLILLIVGFVVANTVLPKATITLATDNTTVDSNLTLSLDSAAKTLDTKQLIVPAQQQQVQKSSSQQVATTGQKNQGDKATGTVTMTAEKCSGNPFVSPSDVPAGTGISTNSMTYITQDNASFVGTGTSGGCYTYTASSHIDITAQSGGSNYNVSGATFTVAGRSDVSATGSASGGTDNIIKVVAQADIDGASQKISSQDSSSVKQQLEQQLKQAGLFAFPVTFAAGTPSTTSSAKVGDQADNVTVTENITYTMLGVKESDLKTLVDNDVKDQIDPSKQTILDEGLDKATFKQLTSSDTAAQVQMFTTATAGPDLKADTIKKQVAGKKSGDIQTMLKDNPGVTSVKVHFSPFWVNVAPKNPAKITVIFDKTNTAAKNNASNP
jgi:hypothetical protein